MMRDNVNNLLKPFDALVAAAPCKLFVDTAMSFGDWLRGQIQKNHLSNAEVARRAGVSGTYISNLVRDFSPNMTSNQAPRPSEKVVTRIAAALNAPENEARLAAGYAPKGEEVEDGLFAGLQKLSPERQQLAKRQIHFIIESLIEETDDTADN